MKRNLIFILTGVCMAVLLGQHLLDNMDNVKVGGFSIQGRTPNNNDEWTLSGQVGIKEENIIVLHDSELEIKDSKGESHSVRSPRCRYLSNMRVIKSTSPVYFSSGKKIKGSGIGYDMFMDKKILKIRSHVHVDLEIPRSSFNEMVKNKDKEDSK